jgi:hypothetical protein
MNVILLFLWHLTICLRAEAASTSHAKGANLSNYYSSENDNGENGYYPTWSYATEPKITSPQTNWLQWSPECDDGLSYFITPRGWGIEKVMRWGGVTRRMPLLADKEQRNKVSTLRSQLQ